MRVVYDTNSGKNNSISSVTLSDWLAEYYDKDSLSALFANMDSAMKYIHSKGYCIRSFNPKDIEILNNSLSQIRFNELMLMPNDFGIRKNIVREDVGKSSFLQIGIYARCLNTLKPVFLKKNFNEFTTFLPEDIVPYYRGVVERDASVYLVDYLKEKRKRDLESLEKEVAGSIGEAPDKRLIKSNAAASLVEYDSMNTKVNDSIYHQLSGRMSDSAFVSFLMIPAVVVILGLIFVMMLILSR